MTEYIAAIMTILGVMFFSIHVAFSLNEKHDAVRFFLICIAMIMGWILIHTGQKIAEEAGLAASIISAISYAYWAWVVTTVLFLIYFGIYFLQAVLLMIQDRKHFRFTEGKEEDRLGR
jgi:hypothetical protein